MKVKNTIDQLKELIIKNEFVENVLIKSGEIYQVVTCSVIDYSPVYKKYLFYVEGYSCSFNIDEIDNWCYEKDCF